MEVEAIVTDLKSHVHFLHNVVGQSFNEIGQDLGISRSTFYRLRKEISCSEERGGKQHLYTFM